MRIFTEKEIDGYARALQTFMRRMNGQRLSVKRFAETVRLAFDGGLTAGQIFNRDNYISACLVIPRPQADEYVNLMLDRAISATELFDIVENDETILAAAEAFHDFYLETSKRGGTFTTPIALENFFKAVKMHSLQNLMSEERIEAFLALNKEESRRTCYQYVLACIKNPEAIAMPPEAESLTQEQTFRITAEEDFLASHFQLWPIDPEQFNDTGDDPTVTVETINDDPNEQANHLEVGQLDPDNSPYDFRSSFNSNIIPEQYKISSIRAAIGNYSLEEIGLLAKCAKHSETLDDIVNSLARGEYDKTLESLEARTVHQNLNSDLIRPFIECVRLQGCEMDESLAANYDVLVDNWDLRDNTTRKRDKVKNLIHKALLEQDDPDLTAALRDIEDMYTKD